MRDGAAHLSLSEARLAEGPVLVRRPDGYVLRYRFPPPRDGLRFAASVDARRTEDAGYYYFVGVVQSTALERGALVERPLARDGLDELAARGRVSGSTPTGRRTASPSSEGLTKNLASRRAAFLGARREARPERGS